MDGTGPSGPDELRTRCSPASSPPARPSRGPGLENCLAKGFKRLVIDCSGLEFCDSTGLNVLLGARLKADAAGGGVHLAGMQPVVARVFEITGAEAVFTLHDSLEAALADDSG
ncbi:hypothetical protein SHIRM173S_03778 [Streptomyces hirsutus]